MHALRPGTPPSGGVRGGWLSTADAGDEGGHAAPYSEPGHDDGDEDIYLDATLPERGQSSRGTVRARDDDDAPNRRLRYKQSVQERKRKERQGGDAAPGDGGLQEDDDDGETLGDQVPGSALAAERHLTKAQRGKLDKEIAWDQIPTEERHLYIEAEKKQWNDHTRCAAVKVLTEEETHHVRETMPKDRILQSRFAHRDKNCAKRREDPSIPPKAKARLCVGGHRDPDLRTGELRTEAPTASKASLSALMVLSSVYHWDVAAGDIECAFLQGMENQRNLYMEQPVRGLPGVQKGVLIQMLKGVFGLCDSPRLWWEKLSTDLLAMEITVHETKLQFKQHPLDACFFLLYDDAGGLHGALTTHVDDLLLGCPHRRHGGLRQALSGLFPISEWEDKSFDYVGSQVTQDETTTEELCQHPPGDGGLRPGGGRRGLRRLPDPQGQRERGRCLVMAGRADEARPASWRLHGPEEAACTSSRGRQGHEQGGAGGAEGEVPSSSGGLGRLGAPGVP